MPDTSRIDGLANAIAFAGAKAARAVSRVAIVAIVLALILALSSRGANDSVVPPIVIAVGIVLAGSGLVLLWYAHRLTRVGRSAPELVEELRRHVDVLATLREDPEPLVSGSRGVAHWSRKAWPVVSGVRGGFDSFRYAVASFAPPLVFIPLIAVACFLVGLVLFPFLLLAVALSAST
jgi:hypothetical protein